MDENMFDLGLDVASINVEIPDPVITLTGSDNYTVPNTADYPLLALSVYGHSKQNTSVSNIPAGKNLFNLLQVTTSNSNIVVNENSITFPKAAGIYRVTIDNYVLEVGKTYTFSAKASQITTLGWELVYADWNSAYLESVGNEIKRTFTIEKEVTKIILYIRHDDATASVTVSNPQIELGSTATSYEPYVGTPTPEAPIPIVSVGDDGSVEVTACGKNLSTVENGFYDKTTGEEKASTKYVRTDIIPYFDGLICSNPSQAEHWISYFDKNLNYLGKSDSIYSLYYKITKKYVETKYVAISSAFQDEKSYLIQVEKNSVPTDYEPYEGNTATITSGLPLCSVGEYRDELIYNADGTGKIIKRVGIVDMGTLPWSYNTTEKRLWAQLTTQKANGGAVMCATYPESKSVDEFKARDKQILSYFSDNWKAVNVRDSSYTDANSFKTAMSGVMLYYELATPQEIELSAAEMAELQKLQSYKGTTNLYNDEQAEMLVKMLRSDYDMKYIEWLKESQTWVCPKAGKWKVICVGGGASGGKYDVTSESAVLTATVAGGTTSFGSVIAANGAPSTTDYSIYAHTATDIGISGYGGYNGISMGGVPSYGTAKISSGTIANGGGNAAAMPCGNPTAAIGYGAGGGAVAHEDKIYLIAGRAGSIESTIVDLEEGQAIMCTIGKGGQTTDAKTMGNGADGVIVVQYLGY